jgi:hypothetical protein
LLIASKEFVMDIVRLPDLLSLMQPAQGPCVTILLPTHLPGPEEQQDAIRLRNVVDRAENLLAEGWLRACTARDWLEPVRNTVIDNEFWKKRSLGLVFFVQAESLQRFRLPIPLEELAIVNHRFYIKPLLPLVCGDHRFLVLTVSQHHVALYRAGRLHIDQIDVPNLPQRIEETLNIEGADRGQQSHLANRWGNKKQTTVFHGQGGCKETHKAEIALFFQRVHQALAPVLQQEHDPLVLAGVDYLLPIFRQSLDYPNVIEEHIHGNTGHFSKDQLHHKAWESVELLFRRKQALAVDQFRNLSASDLATEDPQTAIQAAFNGRVDTLFVDLSEHLWGTCSPYGQVTSTHIEPQPGDEDLLDRAAAQTLLHGGKVHALEPAYMPGNQPLAAVLRY